MKPFGGQNFRENELRCTGDQWPCAYCGRPIRNKNTAVHVFICCDQFDPSGGEEAHKNHGNNMGGYPLGPDCAKKFRLWKASTTGATA